YIEAEMVEQTYFDLASVIKQDKWHHFHRYLILKDGTKKYVEIYAKPIFIDDECVSIHGTLQDITDKQNQQKIIAEKDKRIEESMRLLKMSNWEIDLKMNEVHYTKEFFQQILEEPEARVLDIAEMLNFVHYDDKNRIIHKMENMVVKEHWDTVDYKLELRNGKIKHVECLCKSKIENGECVGIYGTIRDITEQRNAELVLIEKQYQLQISNDLQQMGIVEYYPSTDNFKLSANINVILEENLPTEISADKYYSYVQDEDVHEIKKALFETIEKYQPFKANRKIKLTNGKIKFIEVACNPHFENHVLVKYVGTFRDITEQTLTEQKWAESEKRFVTVNDIINTGTWQLDIKTQQITVSDELCAIFEEDYKTSYSVDEYFNFLFDDERKKAQAFLESNIEAKREFEAIRKIKLGNGKTKYIELKAKPIIENNVLLKYIGTLTDITEKRINELSLQTSEARFRLFFEHNPIMYFIVNNQGITLSVNNFGLTHLGYTRDELINQHVLNVFHPEDKEKAQQHLADLLQSKENLNQWELRKVKKDGTIIWVKETAKATFDIDGNVMFLILCEDITDEVSNRIFLKQKHDELIVQKDFAELAAKEKQQLASVLSHEIRTPLNAIIGLANLLLVDNPTTEQTENLNTLKFSAENLMLLVTDMLDLSNIESGNFKLEKIPFNLSHIFNGIQHSFEKKASEKNLHLTTTIDPKIPGAIVGDPVRLMQVMNNLVSNAIKFTNYGSIQIIAKRKELISPTELIVRFEVKDTGIGIPAQRHEKIFDMFNHTELDTNRKYGSTGLGLSITKKIVQLFNSKILLESEPGNGSRFYFDVHYYVAEEINATQNEEWNLSINTKRSLEGLNVLLVEDNVFNQVVMMKFLDKWKVNVDLAINGLEAIQKTKTTSDYHIILMDMHMPELSGIDTTVEIRKSKNIFWQRIPIIALTADAINYDKESLKTYGITDLIYKPFDPVDLFKKLIQYSSIFED
ncbi:MAG: hypothetical protein RIQ33_506, partial [Bacteroidota bacterium]